MLVYRITRVQFANDLSGEGNRLYGSRWIPAGVPSLYAAQNRALAALEFYVHISREFTPGRLKLITIDIPATIKPFVVSLSALPEYWDEYPFPPEVQSIGADLFKSGNMVIQVPSTLVPHEFNFVINTVHANMKNITIVSTEDFSYDERLVIP
jgi:RES domain-containing protein